jgi:hypothetical protein
MTNPRARGVRLSDLDRSQVYRIGFVGRGWRVLGPEPAPGIGAGPETSGGARAGAEPRAGTSYVPRHAGPAADPD